MVGLPSTDSLLEAADPNDTWSELPVSQPQRFGSYRLVHPIASGAMGDVFRAYNEASGETVALKMMRMPGATHGDRSGNERVEKERMLFMREMSMLCRLRHPRIVGIRDFGSLDGQLFMAMEYVKTIDLRAELTRCPLSQQVRLVAGIGCYILAALDYAHSHNVVHRDIKPANVLVYRNRKRSDKIGIKLADFGMSKDMRSAGISGMTCDGEVRGTPAFMSPEQLLNSRDAGPASDIYSTAALLYYFLSGAVPHQQDQSFPVRLCRIVDGEAIPLRHRRADLPSQLCDVIDQGLRALDHGRYQNAIEFNQALIPFTRKREW